MISIGERTPLPIPERSSARSPCFASKRWLIVFGSRSSDDLDTNYEMLPLAQERPDGRGRIEFVPAVPAGWCSFNSVSQAGASILSISRSESRGQATLVGQRCWNDARVASLTATGLLRELVQAVARRPARSKDRGTPASSLFSSLRIGSFAQVSSELRAARVLCFRLAGLAA
jgi:hypothetical protein